MSDESIAEMLGIDLSDPLQRHASDLVREEHSLIDALVSRRRETGLSRAEVARRIGQGERAVAEFEATGCEKALSFVTRYAHAVGAMVSHQVEEWRP